MILEQNLVTHLATLSKRIDVSNRWESKYRDAILTEVRKDQRSRAIIKRQENEANLVKDLESLAEAVRILILQYENSKSNGETTL